jgi:hypothetical protein
VFAEGGRKGGVWLPEGRDGRGWRRFGGELQCFLVLVLGGGSEVSGKCSLSSAKPIPTKRTEAGESGECSEHRSFAEVLKSIPELELRRLMAVMKPRTRWMARWIGRCRRQVQGESRGVRMSQNGWTSC